MFRCCMFRCIILFLVFFKVRWWNINFLNSSPLSCYEKTVSYVACISTVSCGYYDGHYDNFFFLQKSIHCNNIILTFFSFYDDQYFLSCDHLIFLPDARRGIWVKLSLDFREWKYSQFNTNYSKMLMLLRVPRHKPIYIVSKANSSNKKSMERNQTFHKYVLTFLVDMVKAICGIMYMGHCNLN